MTILKPFCLAALMLAAAPVLAQHNHGPAQQTAPKAQDPKAQDPKAQDPKAHDRSHGGHGAHGAHGAHGMSSEALSPASKAFADANARMHKDMTIQPSGNADVDFARGMIPHHQGAIDMSGIVLAHGSDPAVKALATAIISAQKKEIAQMQAWLQKNAGLPAGPDAALVSKAFADVNAQMHRDMTMAFSGKADIDFMKGMIPHHAGAVDMAKVLLQLGKDPELRKLAEDVIRTQNEEITMMRDWLKKNGS